MSRAILCLLCLFAPAAGAIVNMEGLHLETPPPGWSGAGDLAFSGNEGNTRTLNLDAALRLRWRRDPVTRFLVASQSYGESRGIKARDRSFLHLRHIRQVRPRHAREAFVQLERDAFARLRLRALTGGGLRLTLAASDRRTALLGLGAFYSRERLSDGTSGEDLDYGQWRGNLYLIFRHRWDAHRRAWLTGYLQPDLASPEDVRATATAGMAADLGHHWQMNWQVDYTFDSRPPRTVGRYDLTYRAGFTRRF